MNIIRILKAIYRHYTTPTTTKALGGLDKSLKKLRAASAQHNRRHLTANRLIEAFTLASEQEAAQRDRALRVSERLEDLVA
ncbi:hypothetical protein [Pararhizobium sp. A13]|uniref:hypothetical protein n=1 Tax=Pararhizobium sp. A13 TaxID=3133975 RepID=UPI003254FA88